MLDIRKQITAQFKKFKGMVLLSSLKSTFWPRISASSPPAFKLCVSWRWGTSGAGWNKAWGDTQCRPHQHDTQGKVRGGQFEKALEMRHEKTGSHFPSKRRLQFKQRHYQQVLVDFLSWFRCQRTAPILLGGRCSCHTGRPQALCPAVFSIRSRHRQMSAVGPIWESKVWGVTWLVQGLRLVRYTVEMWTRLSGSPSSCLLHRTAPERTGEKRLGSWRHLGCRIIPGSLACSPGDGQQRGPRTRVSAAGCLKPCWMSKCLQQTMRSKCLLGRKSSRSTAGLCKQPYNVRLCVCARLRLCRPQCSVFFG